MRGLTIADGHHPVLHAPLVAANRAADGSPGSRLGSPQLKSHHHFHDCCTHHKCHQLSDAGEY